MCGILNFENKVEMSLQKIGKKNSVPSRDLGYQALGLGIRANLIFSYLSLDPITFHHHLTKMLIARLKILLRLVFD